MNNGISTIENNIQISYLRGFFIFLPLRVTYCKGQLCVLSATDGSTYLIKTSELSLGIFWTELGIGLLTGTSLKWLRFLLRVLPSGVSNTYDLGWGHFSITLAGTHLPELCSWYLICWPGTKGDRSLTFCLSWYSFCWIVYAVIVL